MKTFLTNFIVLLILTGNSNYAFTQTFCLQMTEVSNDGSNLILDISMSGDVAFELGTSNLEFFGTVGAFGPASLVTSPLSPPVYVTPTVTQPLPGSNSINLELGFPGNGATVPADPNTFFIAQISMPILNSTLANDGLSWTYTGSTTGTVVFKDDEATQTFATNITCLEGYAPSIVDGCTDSTAANYEPAATIDDGSCLYDVTFNVDMNCESGFTQPALEGPFFGWCGGCVPLADPDMDGIWSIAVQIPAGPFEYKYAVDNFANQEDLVDDMILGGTCAPITNFSTYANRQVEVSAGVVVNDTYGTCGSCDPSVGCTNPVANNFSASAITDDGSCLYDVTFNVDLNCYDGNDPNIDAGAPGGFTTISIEGPFAGWCGSCVTLSDTDSDGIWTVTLELPEGPFEFKYAHDSFAGQEQLVDDMLNGGTCAPITDFDGYANREIIVPATLETNDTYGSCDSCGEPCPTDLNMDGETDGEDFSIFLGNYGLTCPMGMPCPTDFDGNGETDGDDFSIFLGNYGIPCE